jgi:hypothetical protein
LGEYCQLAVAVNEVRRQLQGQQTYKRFARHWARNDVASYNNLIDVGLTYFVKDGL